MQVLTDTVLIKTLLFPPCTSATEVQLLFLVKYCWRKTTEFCIWENTYNFVKIIVDHLPFKTEISYIQIYMYICTSKSVFVPFLHFTFQQIDIAWPVISHNCWENYRLRREVTVVKKTHSSWLNVCPQEQAHQYSLQFRHEHILFIFLTSWQERHQSRNDVVTSTGRHAGANKFGLLFSSG